jgi:predicted Zn finger-like uncharacterized protein
LHPTSENVIRSTMRITCPDCAAQYELPPEAQARLPMRVRCAQCGTEWQAEPPPPAEPEVEPSPSPDSDDEFEFKPIQSLEAESASSPEPEPPAPEPGQPARLETPIEPPSRPTPAPPTQSPSARTLWIGSILLLIALIVLVLALHGPISRAWPPSQRLFDAIGLSAPPT